MAHEVSGKGIGGDDWRKCFRKIKFSTSIPGNKKKVTGVKATLNGETLDAERVAPPPVTVIPDEIYERANHARQNIYKVLNQTFACNNEKGHRLVSIRKSRDFVIAFEEAKEAFNAVAEDVADMYDEIMAFNRDYWRPRFASELEYQTNIGNRLPRSRDSLRAEFNVTIYDLEVNSAPAFFEDELVAGFFEAAKTTAREMEEALRVELYTKPLEALAAQCEKLLDAEEDGKKITIATIDKLEAAVKLYMSCSEVQNPDFTAKVQRMAKEVKKVRVNAEARRDASTSSNYTAHVKAAVRAMTETIAGVVNDAANEVAMFKSQNNVAQQRALELEEVEV